ncbi:MAG TPA: Gfo/Idh/MocA family oxidoreductase [Chthoniobacteraceae bacterium]|nr:Gfo/Idh/MocA family oxidoreductase [Chthoniobacteraceae bacterium]
MSDDVYGAPRELARGEVPAPILSYQPPVPERPGEWPIGVIGCGGITRNHLAAYRQAGFCVVALSSRSLQRATALRDEFFPEAAIFEDWRALLRREDIHVVDVTTHPEVRAPIIEAALRGGKHVLSQKPLALDLPTAERLVGIAEQSNRKLAVNQNGRWAPHFAWMREAVSAGLIGDVSSVDFAVHWDHHWICGTPFEQVSDLLLADFAIHWFDLACCFFGDRMARSVFAASARSPSQRAKPPFLAHACVEFERGQATFAFNADTAFGHEDRTTIVGACGTLRSVGPSLLEQRVTLHSAEGSSAPELAGNWFREGFIGTMGELLCSLEQRREPLNAARTNLRSLALCFAAVRSASEGLPRDLTRYPALPTG